MTGTADEVEGCLNIINSLNYVTMLTVFENFSLFLKLYVAIGFDKL